ncbi:MAG: Glycine/D-amino acid oxidase (deaminating), partial [Verrucomicrobia bacterium]
VRVDRFEGKMGMFTLNHLEVHLRNNLLRLQGGLRVEACVVSAEAEFLGQIPVEFAPLYTVVPQSEICALLESPTDRYRAVLFSRKGCANSALLTQQVLGYLQRHYPERFRYVDRTPVQRIVLNKADAILEAGSHKVKAGRVVLCTNGFTDHVVENSQGEPLISADTRWVKGNIGYMAAFVETEQRKPDALSFIRNTEIGGAKPYVYVTRRPHDVAGETTTLTCMGGPERPLEACEQYDLSTPFPGRILSEMDAQIRPLAQPQRPPGTAYDYTWHGLMGYTQGGIRRIGAEPCNPVLLYNLGCNGVGFLPSVCGGERVSRILAGEPLAPSIFDPK